MSKLFVVATLNARAGQEAELSRELLAMVEPSRAEAGCRRYDLHQSDIDPAHWVIYEEWRSRADLDRHFETPHFLALQSKLDGLLAKPLEVTTLDRREPASEGDIEPRALGPDGEVVMAVHFDVHADQAHAFETAFRRSITESRKEPGAQSFRLYKLDGAPGRYMLYEIWSSADALRSHLAEPYTEDLFATFERALAEPVRPGSNLFFLEEVVVPEPAEKAEAA